MLSAQTPGTVKGIVTDAITGAPVKGVEVLVVGAELLASTDDEGQYTIAPVPPGLVKIQAQVIGYVPITTPYYTVLPDSTTMVNFKLAPVFVELDPLEVKGEDPAEEWHFGSQVLTKEQLPGQGNILDAVGGLVAGVTKSGRYDRTRLRVRGSRNEVLYVVNGSVITPPLQFYIDAADVECVDVRRGDRAAQEFRRYILGPIYSGVVLIWTRGSTEPKPAQCYGNG
jgi:hypothetical protein